MDKEKIIKVVLGSSLPENIKGKFAILLEKEGATSEVVQQIMKEVDQLKPQIKESLRSQENTTETPTQPRKTVEGQEMIKIIDRKIADIKHQYEEELQNVQSQLDQTYQEATEMIEEDRQQVIKNSLE